MDDQVRLQTKLFPQSGHLKGHSPSQALVGEEVGALAESLPILPTLVGTFTSVHLLVGGEGGDITEDLPTSPTRVEPLPSVEVLAVDEVAACAKALPTFQALVDFSLYEAAAGRPGQSSG